MKKILFLFFLIFFVGWSVWYITPKALDYFSMEQGGCTVPRIHTGAKRQRAADMYQNINKFLINVDYGEKSKKELSFLKCKKDDDCNVTEMYNYSDADLYFFIKKYKEPYQDKKIFEDLLSEAVHIAYKHCIDNPIIEFTDDPRDERFKEEDTLGILLKVERTKDNTPEIVVSTKRYQQRYFSSNIKLLDYYLFDPENISDWKVPAHTLSFYIIRKF